MADRLGRGLSALLGEAAEGDRGSGDQAPLAPGEGVREIPIELIHRNPTQPRIKFDDANLRELEQSIRAQGVLQPILVRPSPKTPGQFEIVAGERRWRGAQRAGVATIPAMVRQLDDGPAFEIAVVENVQRADLSALEEARAYDSLMGIRGYTQERVAEVVGKSRSHVTNTLRLMKLPPMTQDHLLEGRITAGHGRALLGAQDADFLVEAVIRLDLSVRNTEALVKRETGGGSPRKAARPKSPDTEALEADLEDALGLSVSLTNRGGSGTLTLSYGTLEQLDDLCRKLMRR